MDNQTVTSPHWIPQYIFHTNVKTFFHTMEEYYWLNTFWVNNGLSLRCLCQMHVKTNIHPVPSSDEQIPLMNWFFVVKSKAWVDQCSLKQITFIFNCTFPLVCNIVVCACKWSAKLQSTKSTPKRANLSERKHLPEMPRLLSWSYFCDLLVSPFYTFA